MKPTAVKFIRADKTAVICAWCYDKERADKWAEERGYEISHTVCDACKAKELRKLEPEKEKAPLVRDEQAAQRAIDAFTEWLARNS